MHANHSKKNKIVFCPEKRKKHTETCLTSKNLKALFHFKK